MAATFIIPSSTHTHTHIQHYTHTSPILQHQVYSHHHSAPTQQSHSQSPLPPPLPAMQAFNQYTLGAPSGSGSGTGSGSSSKPYTGAGAGEYRNSPVTAETGGESGRSSHRSGSYDQASHTQSYEYRQPDLLTHMVKSTSNSRISYSPQPYSDQSPTRTTSQTNTQTSTPVYTSSPPPILGHSYSPSPHSHAIRQDMPYSPSSSNDWPSHPHPQVHPHAGSYPQPQSQPQGQPHPHPHSHSFPPNHAAGPSTYRRPPSDTHSISYPEGTSPSPANNTTDGGHGQGQYRVAYDPERQSSAAEAHWDNNRDRDQMDLDTVEYKARRLTLSTQDEGDGRVGVGDPCECFVPQQSDPTCKAKLTLISLP